MALKDEPESLLPWALLVIGLVGWLSFYVMDRWWYHRFLEGAGEQAGAVETWLAAATGTGKKVFNLSETIKQKSAISIGKKELRSKHRIDLFYGVVALAAAGLAYVFYSHAGGPKEIKPTQVVLKTDGGPIPVSLPSLPACVVMQPAAPTQQVAPPSPTHPPRGGKRK